MRAFLIVVCMAGLMTAEAVAVPPSWLTMMPSVQKTLLAHEQTRAAKTAGHPSVSCRIVYGYAPTIECETYTLTPNRSAKSVQSAGGQTWWISRVASATVHCAYSRANKCVPTPVCTYTVSVTSGPTLSTSVFGGILNVCRKGWANRIK